MTTTLQVYTRHTDHHDSILDALGGKLEPLSEEAPDDPDDEDGPTGSLAVVR